jgi:hypothetical protein
MHASTNANAVVGLFAANGRVERSVARNRRQLGVLKLVAPPWAVSPGIAAVLRKRRGPWRRTRFSCRVCCALVRLGGRLRRAMSGQCSVALSPRGQSKRPSPARTRADRPTVGRSVYISVRSRINVRYLFGIGLAEAGHRRHRGIGRQTTEWPKCTLPYAFRPSTI